MAMITNKSDRRISPVGRTKAGAIRVLSLAPHANKDGNVDPESSKEFDDHAAKNWCKKSSTKRLIAQGIVAVSFEKRAKIDAPKAADDLLTRIPEMKDSDELERIWAEGEHSEEIQTALLAQLEKLSA
jgi:hypothetical protein